MSDSCRKQETIKIFLSGKQRLAWEGSQGEFGVLPRTDQDFLESVRLWICSRHSCFYNPQAVASLHPNTDQAGLLRNCVVTPLGVISCPLSLTNPLLGREGRKEVARGTKTGTKACIEGFPALGPGVPSSSKKSQMGQKPESTVSINSEGALSRGHQQDPGQ